MSDKPRVDFYKLNSQSDTALKRFCCQLADKVVNLGHTVYVRTPSAEASRVLDDLMWTYSDNSFLPHGIAGSEQADDVPVLIGHEPCRKQAHLLINLADERPADTDAFERVAEIINDSPQLVRTGRSRYTAYKQDDYPLYFHDIKI